MFITIKVIHMFLNKRFILASNSASRFRLLKNVGLNFIKTTPLCNEEFVKESFLKKNFNIFNLPKFLAKEKALSVSRKKTKHLVVGSDTIILYQNKIINKAKNLNEAREKIKKLSGKKHQIISGVSICCGGKQIWTTDQKTTISLYKLNNKQINEYLKHAGKDILSSVGCYQAEKLGPQIIKSIRGDFFNVLGFPLFPFLSFLKKYK